MNEKPILFSGAMVREILSGHKTQTRRIMKTQPTCKGALDVSPAGKGVYVWPHDNERQYYCEFPYDHRLWVRETWRAEELEDGLDVVRYKADGSYVAIKNTPLASEQWSVANNNQQLWIEAKWKPSIFMPRWASRINLDVILIRVERVQDITRDDAKAEGVSGVWTNPPAKEEHYSRALLNPYVANFSVLWDEINAPRGFGWDVNPWVWVLEYKVVEVNDAS